MKLMRLPLTGTMIPLIFVLHPCDLQKVENIRTTLRIGNIRGTLEQIDNNKKH